MKVLVVSLLLLWGLGVAVGFEGRMIHSLLLIAIAVILMELLFPSKSKNKRYR